LAPNSLRKNGLSVGKYLTTTVGVIFARRGEFRLLIFHEMLRKTPRA